MAVTKSASLQRPMPSLGSGEMLGAWKVPTASLIARPPPSRVRSSWSGVAWQAGQPPAKNMVRPLARSGRCGASAPAGTVAGMVAIQNAPNPNAMTLTARIANRRMRIVPFHWWGRRHATRIGRMISGRRRITPRPRKSRTKPEGRRVLRRVAPRTVPNRPARPGRQHAGSALLHAIVRVASAAVLLHRRKGLLETRLILHLGGRLLRVGAELGELGVDVGLLLPDRRQRRGFAPGLGIFGKQVRHLGGGVLVLRENRLCLGKVERLLALHVFGAQRSLLAVGFHQSLAGRDRVLRDRSGKTEREGGHGKHGAPHRVFSLGGGRGPHEKLGEFGTAAGQGRPARPVWPAESQHRRYGVIPETIRRRHRVAPFTIP